MPAIVGPAPAAIGRGGPLNCGFVIPANGGQRGSLSPSVIPASSRRGSIFFLFSVIPAVVGGYPSCKTKMDARLKMSGMTDFFQALVFIPAGFQRVVKSELNPPAPVRPLGRLDAPRVSVGRYPSPLRSYPQWCVAGIHPAIS